MKDIIGIVYAISEAAGNTCQNLVCKMAPNNIDVIIFPDPQVEAFQHAKTLQDKEEKINFVTKTLYRGIEKLAADGATMIILAANSVHIAFDNLSNLVAQNFPHIQMLSIVDAATNDCKKYNTVAIFGSNPTIESGMYQEKLRNEKINILPCEKSDQAIIHQIISSGYTAATMPDNLRQEIYRICTNLKNNGCDAVVLACTELPMLLNENNYAGLNFVDSNKALAEYAIRALSEKSLSNVDIAYRI